MSSIQEFDLQRFLDLIDHDLELYESLLGVFSSDWPEVVKELKAAKQANDSESAQKFGHRLKGNLRNFYAEDLATRALKIEEMGRSGDLSELDACLSELELRMTSLEAQLKEKLVQLKSEQG